MTALVFIKQMTTFVFIEQALYRLLRYVPSSFFFFFNVEMGLRGSSIKGPIRLFTPILPNYLKFDQLQKKKLTHHFLRRWWHSYWVHVDSCTKSNSRILNSFWATIGRIQREYTNQKLRKNLPLLSQLYTYRQIDENAKKCWRNGKCIDGKQLDREIETDRNGLPAIFWNTADVWKILGADFRDSEI